MRRQILESGLVRKLNIPDPHLYFQAPGGQVLRLVGIDEDLSFYEGAGEGPDVAKVKEAAKKWNLRRADRGIQRVDWIALPKAARGFVTRLVSKFRREVVVVP